MVGPVWVTCPERLQLAGLKANVELEKDQKDQIAVGEDVDAPQNRLNLGWLLLESSDQTLKLQGVPEEWQTDADEWNTIEGRVVLVSDKLFGQVVDANLEVRTSVSIDPYTGAAEQGALFTYEAIPRSAFLVSEVVEDDFRGAFPPDQDVGESPLDVVDAGFEMIEWLGVGGMGTRGFGRMRLVGQPREEER
jgi:CRISPR-associated protein Cmr4